MIDLLKRFLDKGRGPGAAQKREEADYTDYDVRVAACALLMEMAHIDGVFSDSERDSIAARLKEDQGLSDEDAAEIMETANRQREGSIDLWQFTNLINLNCSEEEKLRIIETVWRLAYADGSLDKHEDYLAHKLANLLRLSHKQLIDAKLRALGKKPD